MINTLQYLFHPTSVILIAIIVAMTILLIVVLKKLSAKQHVDQAIQVNNTFRKFIPQQFFEHHVNYGSELFGSGKADNLAILFCDIRGFTGLSEQMAPQELMNFLTRQYRKKQLKLIRRLTK